MQFRRSRVSRLRILLICAAGFLGFGVLTTSFRQPAGEEAQTVPILERIQQIGRLHTVRYNLHDIYRHETSVKPDGVWGELPGVRSLYRAATRNRVLVVGEGGVEAGVDLAKVTASDVARVATPEGVKLRVRLPRAAIFPPDVKVRVVERKRGVFWNDENIVPEATESLKDRFIESALSRRILAEAETNALKLLSNMQDLTESRNVEFYF